MFGAKVRQPNGGQELAYLVFILEVHVFDLEAFLMAQGVEVLDREQADVRRIVPFVGEFLRNRHAAVKHQASASRPVTEIRECHDDLLGYAQKLVQKGDRVANFLNRAIDNGVVETAVLEVGNATFVQVALDDRHIFFEAVENSFDVFFDAKARDFLLVDKVIQQVAAAATEVEHMASFLYEFAEEVKVVLVVEYRHCLRSVLRDNLRIEESAYSFTEFAHFNQESVMAKLRVEFEACHSLAGVDERACNAAALVRREKPVGRKVHVQDFSLDALECVFNAAVFRFEVECVGCMCDVQVAVRIKAVDELRSLIT